jgi:hypothetical protein
MLLVPSRRLPRISAAEPPPPPSPEGGVTYPFPSDWSGPVVDVPATVTNGYSNTGQAANTLFDARGSVLARPWPGFVSSDTTINTVSINSNNPGINWYGGFIFYDVPPDFAYQDHYHPPGFQTVNHHGLLSGVSGSGVRITAARLDNCWDGFSHQRANNWNLRGCMATHNHDDFIENDTFASGVLENCLADGVYVFYSMRQGNTSWMSPETPQQQTVTIQNNVVRLKGFPIDPGVTTPQGCGGLFKVHDGFTPGSGIGTHAKLRIINNWFLVEAIRYIEFSGHSEDHKLGFPLGGNMIVECSGNHLVWVPPSGAPATFPGVVPASGVSLYNGAQFRPLWEAKRDEWLANHQEVDQRASVRP